MSPRRKRPLTPLELAARRRNAQRSTGPRTPAGKFRSSLNALKYDPIPIVLSEMIRFRGEDIREYREMHRELIALFLPQDVRQSECLAELAQACWEKVRALRAPEQEGFRQDRIREAEERIEAGLASLIELWRGDSRKWRYLLQVMLGGTFSSLAELRTLVESHLEVVTRAAVELAMSRAGMAENRKEPLI